MAKKQDVYYFNNFVACAEESCHAAHLLKDVLANFNPDDLTIEKACIEKIFG